MTGTFSTTGNINTPSNYQIGGTQVIKANSDNTYIGKNAGYSATGAGNVFLGYQAGYNETGNYKLYIDNSSTSSPLIYGEFNNGIVQINGDFYVTGDTYMTSDARKKKDIKPIDSSLEKIKNIRGVSFKWDNDESKTSSERTHYGVVAQEIKRTLPELVKENENGEMNVAYMELIPVLIEAMKEQQREQQKVNEKQQKIITEMAEEIKELKRALKLKSTLAAVVN